MRRIISLVILVMMSVMTSLQAQESKTLTANQWKRGIAITGQHAALDGRYGRAESEFPKDYTLDDLNDKYKKVKKWGPIYERLKPQEDRPADIDKLKEIARACDTQPGGVVRKLEEYIKTHPEKAVTPVAEEKPAPEVKAEETVVVNADAENVDSQLATEDSIAVINTTASVEKDSDGGVMMIIINIISLIVAAGALVIAYLAKKENAELRKELEYTSNKLTSQFEKFSKNITTDLNRVTYKVNKRKLTDGDVTISFNDDVNVVRQAQEPKRYFLTKADMNDCFIRATEAIEIGNSLFELTTNDGITGTYRVIDHPEVHHFALMMPTENLLRACTGNSIQISSGKTKIVTDREGTARFDEGRWRVAVKAVIHYEA